MKLIQKHKALIIIITLVALFIASLLLTPKNVSFLIQDATTTQWLADAKSEKYTIVTLSQTTCGACKSFNPTAKQFAERYDINFYWFDVDKMSQEEYKVLGEQFPKFESTPYTVVLKDGKIKKEISGAVDFANLEKQVKDAGVTLTKRVIE